MFRTYLGHPRICRVLAKAAPGCNWLPVEGFLPELVDQLLDGVEGLMLRVNVLLTELR